MKIYIFDGIKEVSERYHPEGSLVIIAKDKDHAKEVVSVDKNIQITDEEWLKVESYELKNSDEKPKYWVMQDAGCC